MTFEHAHDGHSLVIRPVDHDVVADREAAQIGPEFRPSPPGKWLVGQHVEDPRDSLDELIGDGFVVGGDIVPNIQQVEASAGGSD